MSCQGPQFTCRGRVPKLDFPIAAARSENLFVGTEHTFVNDIRVSIQSAQELPAGHIPQFYRAVKVAGDQRSPVTAESNAKDSRRGFLRRRKIVAGSCLRFA